MLSSVLVVDMCNLCVIYVRMAMLSSCFTVNDSAASRHTGNVNAGHKIRL